MKSRSDHPCRGWLSRCAPVVLATITAIGAPETFAASTSPPPTEGADQVSRSDVALDVMYGMLARNALGLGAGDVVTLALGDEPEGPITVTIPIDGRAQVIDLVPWTVRSESYQLLVQRPDGLIVPGNPGAVRSMRGTVRGVPGSRVAASLLEDGLHAMIHLGDEGGIHFLEPIDRIVAGSGNRHIIYENIDVLPNDLVCGGPDALAVEAFDHAPDAGAFQATAGTGVCTAQLACDADFEFYNAFGSVTATEARIISIVNAVNMQYEQQVGLTHQISAIMVRTGSNDPYTTTIAEDRLCQFILEWTNNQTGVQRDVAHLFTGVDLFGTTIGIAADIGGTGICVNSGACTGGTYGPRGSYSIAQSNFDANFSCATDLTAHEMGHLWGAFHCSCTNNTMNSGITCTNSFSAGSISSIMAYRDTRNCLSGSCASGPISPVNDSCASATMLACNSTEVVNTSSATPPSGTPDPELPSGSPSCQWQGTPTNVHNTVWYSFVALDTSVEIATCNTVGIDDTTLALYDGSCGSLSELACSEDTCGASTYMSRICYEGLTPGNTYLIMVGHPGGWASSTPGQVILDLNCPCPDIGPVAGACCLPSGGCSDLETPTSCAAAGGTFQGAGSDCASSNCGPATEACCLPGGACIQATPTDCATQSGTPRGPGTTCNDTDGDGTADLCDDCPNDPDKTAPGACGCGNPDTDADNNGTPDCNDIGACCVGTTCSVETQADCAVMGGVFQGTGTDCSGSPCAAADVDNVATADLSTGFGSVSSGSFVDTRTQNDAAEAITEEQTNGNPNRRRSRLQHTWTFNVAAGSIYTFFVDAYHTPNGEGDDFAFSFSLDNASYTDMLTVTKTADNDVLQSYVFGPDVSGTVYVRVEDLDRSQGNSSLDTVFIDEMFIRTSTGPDTMAPAAPTSLVASGGDGVVSLNWNDSPEGDLDGYNVFRSLTSGGPYGQVNGALLGSSSFSDTTVSNGTTYYYIVTAVDTSGNESADSNEASATPQAGGNPAVHVESIVVFTVNIGQGKKQGAADVVVVDETGSPVSAAMVTGSFTGDLNETVGGTTDANGFVHLQTLSFKKGGVSITFCVTDITYPTLPYDPGANVETCDVN